MPAMMNESILEENVKILKKVKVHTSIRIVDTEYMNAHNRTLLDKMTLLKKKKREMEKEKEEK